MLWLDNKFGKIKFRIRGRIRRTALVLSCSYIKCLFSFRIGFQISFLYVRSLHTSASNSFPRLLHLPLIWELKGINSLSPFTYNPKFKKALLQIYIAVWTNAFDGISTAVLTMTFAMGPNNFSSRIQIFTNFLDCIHTG